MSGLNLFELTKQFHEHGILITFSGPFTHKIIEELGNAIRTHLASEDMQASSTMQVFAVFVEQAQNVKNYVTGTFVNHPNATVMSTGIVSIAKKNDAYTVTSGNMILNQDAEQLSARIDKLNTLDRKQLRALYKEQARKPLPQGALGAGLGLIDMARTAQAPLSYSIEQVNEQLSFFCLTVLV